MPAISLGNVLVTGANGFVGMAVIDAFMTHGYNVRAVVRSVSKGAYIKQYFAAYGARIEIVVVPDYLKVWITCLLDQVYYSC